MKAIAAHTLWLVLVVGGCSKSEKPAPKEVPSAPAAAPVAPVAPVAKAMDPEAAKTMISSGAVVIDVRTTEEFAEGHLPQAVNIPIEDWGTRISEVEKLAGNDKARPIVVYCAAGARAAKAKAQLDAAGYSRVVNGGGLDDLK